MRKKRAENEEVEDELAELWMYLNKKVGIL